MQDRIDILRDKIPPDVDGAMITSAVNRRYLTGFPSSAGTLLVLPDTAYFIIDSRYFEAAKAAAKGCSVLLQNKLYEQVTDLLAKHGVTRMGIEEDSVSLSQYSRMTSKLPGIEILTDSGLSDAIGELRTIKSADELRSMRDAQAIAEKCFDHIRGFIRPGLTEREIQMEMMFYCRKQGSEEEAFSFIISSGPNGSKPHAVPGDRQVQNGDLITMDFGCTVDGYRSDMTRTVALGRIGGKQREVYDLVLKAQLESLKKIAPGIVCREVDKIARDIIDGSPYQGMFGHGLGHAVGLEIHENPRFNQEDETVLKPGHVLSVEPGIYIPGEFGVRIEDVVAVTETGHENLMSSPKELITL